MKRKTKIYNVEEYAICGAHNIEDLRGQMVIFVNCISKFWGVCINVISIVIVAHVFSTVNNSQTPLWH